MEKYKYTGESKQIDGHWVHRIVALKDFECNGHKVSQGSYGGWLEKMENLAQEGTCWVFDDAVVMENSHVVENVGIFGNSVIFGNACIKGNAQVFGGSTVYDFARVGGNAKLEESYVFGRAEVAGWAHVDESSVYEKASVGGWALVENSEVHGRCLICDNSFVRRSCCSGHAMISGCCIVDRSVIGGGAMVYGQAKIISSDINHTSDYIVFNNNWSSVRYFTYVFPSRMWAVGCFYGNSEQLLQKAAKDSPEKATMYALFVALVNAMENLTKGEPALCLDRIAGLKKL